MDGTKFTKVRGKAFLRKSNVLRKCRACRSGEKSLGLKH